MSVARIAAVVGVIGLLSPGAVIGQVSRQGGEPPQIHVAFDVMEQSISDLQAAMASGRVTSRALVIAYLARIAAYDHAGPGLNAVIALNPRALDQADALDRERRDRGLRGPLHGIPIVVKDNFETEELPTTAGSVALAGMETGRDAFQVRKLREAGAVIIAKTNLHELASGITTISSLGGQTRNPYDLSRAPGGSSGGTGAAVAASFAAAGLGTDTCGSIRIPAAHNNLFGMRATMGLSSRRGIVPLSHSQDVGGPLARSVTDLAILLDATVGVDPEDVVTNGSAGRVPRSYRDGLRTDALKGARIGILKSLFGDAQEDQDVAGIVRKATEALKAQGAELLDISVPGAEELLRNASVINYEFKFDFADYLATVPGAPVRSVDDLFTGGAFHASLENGLKTRNQVATRDSEDYRRTLVRRGALRDAVQAVIDEQRLDAIVYPTLRRKPAVIGEAQAGSNCQLSATTGLPALGVPAGFTTDGLPVGMDLLGGPFTEARLLALAYAYEQAVTPRRAPLMTPTLVDGHAPAPQAAAISVRRSSGDAGQFPVSVVGRMLFDPATSRLAYNLTTSGLGDDPLMMVHRGSVESPGPIVLRLADGASSTGELLLGPSERAALEAGQLYLEARGRQARSAAIRSAITLAPVSSSDPARRRRAAPSSSDTTR